MKRRNFGATWWGKAWVEALEGRASLDPNRLPRGRTYARKDRVGALTVAPGEIGAWVRGSRPTPYRVTVRTHRFSEAEWDVLLAVISEQVGHAAALLDAELPPELAERARAADVDLLPGPGDLRPRCSCPDSADPCKHAAALCYLVADEVDADPFTLLLLRGRGRDELLTELRARRSRPSTVDHQVSVRSDDGVTPKAAFAHRPAEVPTLPAAPDQPGSPTPLPIGPPVTTGLRAEVLTGLAGDAAARAWALLTGSADAAVLSVEEDLARLAAERLASPHAIGEMAAAAGMPVRELIGWATAWREAGRGGLAALRETWRPSPGQLAAARAELDESELPGETRIWRNRLTRGDLQLRLGEDCRWYRFVRDGQAWRLDGPGVERPLDVLF